MHMYRSHLAGEFYFAVYIYVENFCSAPETEIWNLTNENHKEVNPTLPNGLFVYGIALYMVPFDFCSA